MEATDLTERLGRWSSGRGSLHTQLSARLTKLIDDGVLAPGVALPPDRALARALAVGRGTIIAAYDTLRAEGRIVRRQGSGTRVLGAGTESAADAFTGAMFSHLLDPSDDVIQLTCAAPDAVPPELVSAYRCATDDLARPDGGIGYYPAGHMLLRARLAERYTERGIPTRPEQLIVTNGAQHALFLLARAYLRPGDQSLVEAPTYPGAIQAFRDSSGTLPLSLPVGLERLEAVAREHSPVLAYIVPSFHNPTGAVLPSLERKRVTTVAAQADIQLIEDEVLRDLAFPGETVPPPLAAYDDAVLSVGSLSKAVWGGLRVGWIRGPQSLIARLARLRAVNDISGNIPAQMAAAYLLPQLNALCDRLAGERRVRHDFMRVELARQLPDWTVPPVTGGQTLWVRLPCGDGTSFAQTALRYGVAVLPGAGLDVSGESDQHIRLHFVLPEPDLAKAVSRLAQAWQAYAPTVGCAELPALLAGIILADRMAATCVRACRAGGSGMHGRRGQERSGDRPQERYADRSA